MRILPDPCQVPSDPPGGSWPFPAGQRWGGRSHERVHACVHAQARVCPTRVPQCFPAFHNSVCFSFLQRRGWSMIEEGQERAENNQVSRNCKFHDHPPCVNPAGNRPQKRDLLSELGPKLIQTPPGLSAPAPPPRSWKGLERPQFRGSALASPPAGSLPWHLYHSPVRQWLIRLSLSPTRLGEGRNTFFPCHSCLPCPQETGYRVGSP